MLQISEKSVLCVHGGITKCIRCHKASITGWNKLYCKKCWRIQSQQASIKLWKTGKMF